jgi:2-dehydropantoate 2-reductase
MGRAYPRAGSALFGRRTAHRSTLAALRRMTTIAVLGPGGVGGFIGAALARANHDVLIVARESTATVIEAEGISVTSVRLGEFVARPRAAPRLTERVDTLIIATKATGLVQALDRVETQPWLVVPLLNGLDHMALVRSRLGDARVAAGTIRVESDRPAPGQVVQTSPSLRVELASDRAELQPALERLAATLRAAEVPVEIGRSEAQILWSKLVRLAALACTTSASEETIGFIRSDPEWRAALVGCIAEAAAVANADGADIDPAAPLRELDEAHEGLGSSMQRDIAAGREPELDAIAGSVLRAAARHGLDCPTIARLSAAIERRRALQGRS